MRLSLRLLGLDLLDLTVTTDDGTSDNDDRMLDTSDWRR